jgi:hypothetical protein
MKKHFFSVHEVEPVRENEEEAKFDHSELAANNIHNIGKIANSEAKTKSSRRKSKNRKR